uniref:Transcription factor protein n=1 Tax=Ciona intestinalis TaxID=7719 RepID=Q4H3X0_CIOIN|nr:transcription factor protein [Ciona intestinalis]BAE06307.1 transcription factor protein [Ciona intestinalis]|eukprot:NP_001071652.1 transcription factor protein [Ciona intestinalis]
MDKNNNLASCFDKPPAEEKNYTTLHSPATNTIEQVKTNSNFSTQPGDVTSDVYVASNILTQNSDVIPSNGSDPGVAEPVNLENDVTQITNTSQDVQRVNLEENPITSTSPLVVTSQCTSKNLRGDWWTRDNGQQSSQNMVQKRPHDGEREQVPAKCRKLSKPFNDVVSQHPIKDTATFSLTSPNRTFSQTSTFNQWDPHHAMCTPSPSPNPPSQVRMTNPQWHQAEQQQPMVTSNSWTEVTSWGRGLSSNSWQSQVFVMQTPNRNSNFVSNQPRNACYSYYAQENDLPKPYMSTAPFRNALTDPPIYRQQYYHVVPNMEPNQFPRPIPCPPTPVSPNPRPPYFAANRFPLMRPKQVKTFEEKTFFPIETRSNVRSRMPNQLVGQLLPQNVSPNDVFCLVPGRLGMPNQGKKHQVLVGEILRRVLTPESLNISLLGPILRKAKSRNGSQYLRERLGEIGVRLPQGRRKTAQCTLFTSLTESEAKQLSEDFGKLCYCNFPCRSLALCAAARQRADVNQSLDGQSIEKAIRMVDEFTHLMTSSSHVILDSDIKRERSVDDVTTTELYNFETLSHGFGLQTIAHAMSTFKNYLQFLKDAR